MREIPPSVLKALALSSCSTGYDCMRKGSHPGESWYVSKRIKKMYRIWAEYPDLGDFGKNLRKQGFALDCMLSGRRRKSMIGYPDLT